ncbi:MAG: hypothetical protein VX899_27165 [Myxococcota bacterium]|nr:hypothetical protein [Myxococcota bacterium]
MKHLTLALISAGLLPATPQPACPEPAPQTQPVTETTPEAPAEDWQWYSQRVLIDLRGDNQAPPAYFHWEAPPSEHLPPGWALPTPNLLDPEPSVRAQPCRYTETTELSLQGTLGPLSFLAQSDWSMACYGEGWERWLIWDGQAEVDPATLVDRDSLLSALEHHEASDELTADAVAGLRTLLTTGGSEWVEGWSVLPLRWDPERDRVLLRVGIEYRLASPLQNVLPIEVEVQPTPRLRGLLDGQTLRLDAHPLYTYTQGELAPSLSLSVGSSWAEGSAPERIWPLDCRVPQGTTAHPELRATLEAPELWCGEGAGIPLNAELHETVSVLGQVGPLLTTLSEHNLPTEQPPIPHTIDLRTGERLPHLEGAVPVAVEGSTILYRKPDGTVVREHRPAFKVVWLRAPLLAE